MKKRTTKRMAIIGATAALLALSPLTRAGQAAPRIIGGHDATGDWPWMALVQSSYQIDGQRRYGECSGLLLAPDWVVTAAHCMFKENSAELLDPVTNDLEVFIGDHPGGLQRAAVDAVHVPHNQTSSSSFRLGNDIALLKLKSPITVADYPGIADQATLDTLRALDAAQRNEYLTALGWGKTSNDSDTIAGTLQQVQLDFVPPTPCNAAWAALGETLVDTVLCAAELNPVNGLQQDTCSGDSGGPLLVGTPPDPFVVGITSFGTPVCANGTPSVYTNLLSQVPFIESRSPLVDIRMALDDTAARHYGAPGLAHAITATARLINDSQANIATDVTLLVSSDNPQVSVSSSCPGGCSGHALTPADAQAVTATVHSLLNDQQATLTFHGSAKQDDYRRRNNRTAAVVIFSQRPDLTVSVTSASVIRHSDGSGQATIEVTVRNLSTVREAHASDAYLTFGLPVGTTLLGVTGSDGHTTPDCNGNVCFIGALAPRGTGLHSRVLTLHLSSGTPQPGTLALAVDNNGPEGEFPADNNSDRYRFHYPSVPPSPGGSGGSGGGGAVSGPALALLALFSLGGYIRTRQRKAAQASRRNKRSRKANR